MRIAFAAFLTLTASACQTAAPDRLPPNAPYPDAGTGLPRSQASGELVVYTATYPSREASRGGIPGPGSEAWRVYSGYTVYSADGGRIGYIQNHSSSSSSDESPSTVLLAPGRYLIRTDLPADHPEIFWVTIEAGKETRIDAMNLPKEAPVTP